MSTWIPVAERMPENGQSVLAYTNRVIRAEWVKAGTMEAGQDPGDIGVYDAAKDEHYLPEGWYESVSNWDEYTRIMVNEGAVTHWMPPPLSPHAIAQPQAQAHPAVPLALTDEQIDRLAERLWREGYISRLYINTARVFARAIERAHGIWGAKP